MRRLAAFSIDLDEIGEYFAIHGLGTTPAAIAHSVYDTALPRILEFATAAELPLTLFVIGRDLERSLSAALLEGFVRRGDELGNHTLDHAYDVSRWPGEKRREQITGAAERIHAATGQRPRGFRAPGYTLSHGLLRDLQELGYEYDSSVFPCPAYYAAKAAVLGMQRLRGRESASVLDSPAVLRAPLQPYRLGEPYYRRGDGLREIPIALTRWVRLPFFGTSIGLLARGPLGARKVAYFARALGDVPSVNLELHGIDFLDDHDGLETLRGLQPGLTIPWTRKAEAYLEVVRSLRGRGYSWLTVQELAREALP